MGVDMDYAALLEPYSEATPPANTSQKRTPEGQRAWLIKRGISEGVADDAMKAVYTELAAGRTFSARDDKPAGYYLDRCLLETARKLQKDISPPKVGMNADDLNAIAMLSRDTFDAVKREGMYLGALIGAGGVALIVAIGGYLLWR